MVRRLMMVAAIAIVCSSCRVDLHVAVALNADGSGHVTVTAIADADVVQRAPDLATDLRLTDLVAAGWQVDGPTDAGDGGLRVVLTHTFQTPAEATTLLAQLNGGAGPLAGVSLERKVSGKTTTFTLAGTAQLTGGLDALGDADLLAVVGGTPYAAQVAAAGLQPSDAVAIDLAVTMPGTVRSTTAERGKGLRWVVPLDGTPVDVATITESKDSRNAWASPVARAALYGLIGWAVVSVCLLVYVLVARRRRRIDNQPWY